MNEINPLISVIVPIYNVDKYVRKCLESLKNQTMKQIEVICIDDGSTDGSGEIAEEYKNEVGWPRFRVIHTKNRGLSAARNRGIDEAKADWLMFVDSDDWVEPEFCRIPYEAVLEYGVDMVVFEAYQTTEFGRIKKVKQAQTIPEVVKAEDVIMSSITWNKLYKKDLFNDIRYPEGHVFEDIATTYKLIHKANQILKVQNYLYYYRYRQGSITHLSVSIDDFLSMSKQRYEELLELGYPREKVYLQMLEAALRYCGIAQNEESIHYQEADKIVKEGFSIRLGGKARIKRRLYFFNKSIYRIVYKLVLYVKGIVCE